MDLIINVTDKITNMTGNKNKIRRKMYVAIHFLVQNVEIHGWAVIQPIREQFSYRFILFAQPDICHKWVAPEIQVIILDIRTENGDNPVRLNWHYNHFL